MKIQHKIIGASVISGVLIWMIDSILDFLFFQEGSFLEVLIYDVHPHHFYIRLVGIGSFLVFGIITAKIMALRKKAEDDLKFAHSDLNQIFNASVPLCVIGKDYKMLKVNDTFCHFFELKKEDVEWAEIIITARPKHKPSLMEKFNIKNKKIITLDVTDSRKTMSEIYTEFKNIEHAEFNKKWTYPQLIKQLEKYLPLENLEETNKQKNL